MSSFYSRSLSFFLMVKKILEIFLNKPSYLILVGDRYPFLFVLNMNDLINNVVSIF